VRTLHLAELRGSWPTWLGVSLVFITTNAALMLSALTTVAGAQAMRALDLDPLDSTAFVLIPAQNLLFCAAIGMIVIGTATSLALGARRGALARLALGGATPAQIASTIMIQLVLVSLVSSVVAAVIALLALRPALTFLAFERAEAGTAMPTPAPVYTLWPLLLTALGAVAVAVLGGLRQTLHASRVAPVEALREHDAGGQEARMRIGRIVASVLTGLVLVAAYATVALFTADPDSETISNLTLLSMTVLIIVAVLLALLAPVVVGPLTRVWVKAVPLPWASWQLARRTVSARARRLVRSVVPVMMTIGLLLGMLAIWESLESTLVANGYDIEITATGPASLLIFLGLPLLIALSGGIGSLIMMSRQRDAELALLGIAGATPAQRVVVPLLEAVIITITATILGVLMAAAAVGVLALGLPAAGMTYAFVPPTAMFSAAVMVSLLINVIATVLPTLRALREVEPVVVGRLVAD
jgi:putative ABC transport system permease protein